MLLERTAETDVQAFAFSGSGRGKPHLSLDERGVGILGLCSLRGLGAWGMASGVKRELMLGVQGGLLGASREAVASLLLASICKSRQFPLKTKIKTCAEE